MGGNNIWIKDYNCGAYDERRLEPVKSEASLCNLFR
jgi:hypothetical protein